MGTLLAAVGADRIRTWKQAGIRIVVLWAIVFGAVTYQQAGFVLHVLLTPAAAASPRP